jgi:hypothetical protein
MADNSHTTTAPQSSSTSSNPPYTPHATSIPDDSTTEYEPTPVHSPAGGPQYEDLPPSYDFALSDARNGGAALDASQIEAHRVSANEGPNDPEVWEYRVRGEGAEEPQEHEEAPAYDGHVPVQHVTSSQNIVVGHVGDSISSSTPITTRSSSAVDDPPHSVPGAAYSGGSQARQAWGPFGAPGNGPFGAPGNGPFGAAGAGPFGAPGNGPFGPGRGFRGDSANFRGRGRRGRRSSSSQDWQALGQNMGKWGEEFGRRMGNWGEQFGRQAGAMGKQFGQRTEQWASAYSAGGGGYNPPARPMPAAGPSTSEQSGPPQYDHPPSYEAPAVGPGQETGVYRSLGPNEYPPEKVPQLPAEKPSAKSLGKQKSKDCDNGDDDDDDDDSSISSDSSDSSDSFDEEDSDFDAIEAKYLSRIDAINKDAEIAASKGKSRELVEHERDIATKEAARKRDTEEYVFSKRSARSTQKRMFKDRSRELTRDYRQRKQELKDKSESSGKGKGKAKKGSGMKELKKDYKAKRRALKRDRKDAKRWWKNERRTMKQGPSQWVGSGTPPEQKVLKGKGKANE